MALPLTEWRYGHNLTSAAPAIGIVPKLNFGVAPDLTERRLYAYWFTQATAATTWWIEAITELLYNGDIISEIPFELSGQPTERPSMQLIGATSSGLVGDALQLNLNSTLTNEAATSILMPLRLNGAFDTVRLRIVRLTGMSNVTGFRGFLACLSVRI